jgi:hypothetical protein
LRALAATSPELAGGGVAASLSIVGAGVAGVGSVAAGGCGAGVVLGAGCMLGAFSVVDGAAGGSWANAAPAITVSRATRLILAVIGLLLGASDN